MSSTNATPRRVRVERNIYRRPTGVYEVGVKDGAGVQRWRTVEGGITAARQLRDEMLARRGRGERVAPNPRLRFGDAAARWLDGPVQDLRPTTRDAYRNAVEVHLRPRFSTRRMDALSPDDMATLVRDLRVGGLAESTITSVLGTVGRIYRYAARRLGWVGISPVSLMLPSERPKPSLAKPRRIFEGEEVEQTIAAADEPWRTMFIVIALTGARISEVCGLTWAHVGLNDPEDAEVEFAKQVDRNGNPVPTKTHDSARTVPIPQALALVLARHKLASRHSQPADYVFATVTGRPVSQRNVTRALRAAQRRAADDHGRPTFPILHERDERGRRMPVPRGALPSLHSFRHTFASRGLLAGESVDEIAFLLGHRDANVTRTVYTRELADSRRRAMRRSRIAAEYAALLPDEPATQEARNVQVQAPGAIRLGR
jgi:integrase